MKPRVSPVLPGMLAAALVLLSACGGGGGAGGGSVPLVPSAIGRLTLDVVWPDPEDSGRLIPANAQSLHVELLKDGLRIREFLIQRPAATTSFSELPLGPLTVRATAYPIADGSGAALATAQTSATIVADTITSIPITLASTIATLEFSPSAVTLAPGGTAVAGVTAKNAAGQLVALAPSAMYYSSNAGFVTPTRNADGSATLTHTPGVGTATITATESGSGKTATLPVTVATSISITPTTSTLSVGASATFSATVAGPANTGVVWSVQEANGGTVTQGGVYTAPATRGTYHVVATSAHDASKKATATVTVRSGSGTVVIN